MEQTISAALDCCEQQTAVNLVLNILWSGGLLNSISLFVIINNFKTFEFAVLREVEALILYSYIDDLSGNQRRTVHINGVFCLCTQTP